MADEAVGHVGHVVGHRQVERRLVLEQVAGRDLVVEVAEELLELDARGALQQRRRRAARHAAPPGQRHEHRLAQRVVRGRQLVEQFATDRDVVITRRLRVVGLDERLVLALGHEPDLLREAHPGRGVEQTDPVAGRAPFDARAIHAARGDEPEREHQRLHVARELLVRRRPVGVAVVGVAVRLEETAQEAAVDLAVVGVQDRVGNVGAPALAGMALERAVLREPARLPPDRQRDRVQRDLGVSLARQQVRVEAEELAAERDEPVEDVVVSVGHAEPDSLGMQRAVAHEVADELRELRAHRARDARPMVGVPVQITERRQRDRLRLADQRIEHHRDAVAGGDLGHPLPDPVAVGVDDLDAVRRRALDAVAARGLHRHDLLGAIDVELRRGARPLVGRHLDVEILPLGAVGVAEASQADQPAARRHEGALHEAARRREHRRLRVAVAVRLADLDGLLPRHPRGVEQVAVRARRVGDRVGRVAVHAHDGVVRVAVLLVALVRARAPPRRARTAGTRGRSSAR